MSNITSLAQYKAEIERRRARVQRVKGELNEHQVEAICALMRQLIAEKKVRSVCEACDLATELLGYQGYC